MEKIGRKHPIHLDVHDRRDTPIIVFLTVCTKGRKPILASSDAHVLLVHMALGENVAGWSILNYAWSYSSILRTSGVGDPAFVTVDQILEIHRSSNLDNH
jgi:hypothetical protein